MPSGSDVTVELLREPADDFARPVQTIRTFEASIDNIIEAIERSGLRVGGRLPSEGELSRQLGVSKPTLRQALRVLERSGLLVVKQGKLGGIFLKSAFLPTEAISHQIATEEHSVLETLRARRLIERPIVFSAMRAATTNDLAEIERTVALLAGDGLGFSEILRADMMFHRAVARATHNRVLEDSLRVIYRHLAPVRDIGPAGDNDREAARIYAIHSEQLSAMTARDADELDRVLDTHFHFLEDKLVLTLGRTWSELFG